MDGMDGVSIAVGGTALTAIGGLIGKFLQARYGRTEIATQPLMVQRSPELIDKTDCDARMSKIERRIDHLESDFDKKVSMIYDRVNACATGIAEINGYIRANKE